MHLYSHTKLNNCTINCGSNAMLFWEKLNKTNIWKTYIKEILPQGGTASYTKPWKDIWDVSNLIEISLKHYLHSADVIMNL